MLIEFRASNHRSLRDEQVLTMEAGRIDGEDHALPRQVPGHDKRLLPVAAIYGANASGKSNVLSALSFMRDSVLFSHRLWSPDDGVPRDQFAWGPKREEPSLFEVTLVLGGSRYEYGFAASSASFLEEWLFAWPNGKKQMWFTRENEDFRFGENFKGENQIIEEVTRSNALFLSAAVQHKHLQLEPLFSWFRSMRPINLKGRLDWEWRFDPSIAHIFDEGRAESAQQSLPGMQSDSLATRFRSMLRNADVGIVDVKLNKTDSDDNSRRRTTSFQLKHQSDVEESWLPLEQESRGTQTLFRLVLPILNTVRDGGLLVVDELESSLHPAVAQKIVRQFNDPIANPNGAQLVFTTHDTNLLGTIQGEPALRRDQVWLTEKNSEGASLLYPLTDYKPRKTENLERGYVQGRYGAVPFLGNFLASGE